MESYNIKNELSKGIKDLINDVMIKLNTNNKVRYLDIDDLTQNILILLYKNNNDIDFASYEPSENDYNYVFKQIYCRYRDYSISSEDITSSNSKTYEYYDDNNESYFNDQYIIQFFKDHYTEFLTNKQIQYIDNIYIISANNRYSINRRIEKRTMLAAQQYIERIFTTYLYMCIYYSTI